MTNEKVTRASEKLLSKLQEAHAQLQHGLPAPYEVLDLLVTAVSKGEEPTETWELLHQAAQREGKVQELAFAYENVAADKRVRLLTVDQQAYIYLWAVHFFGGQFGDPDGALTYGQRALAVDPAHQATFEALEYFLENSPSIEQLAPLYLKAAQHEDDPGRQLAHLLRASELVVHRPADDDLARNVYEALLVANPHDFSAREALAARYLQMRQPHEAAKLFEQALEVKPPLEPHEQRDIRERLIDLYQSTLGQPERALPHVEGLLQVDPNHASALAVAESLLEHRTAGLRATAALSDAYAASGKTELAIHMLNIELARVRGPRRVEVGRRLAIYRQDVLNDPAGALELLGPVVAGEPGNDEMRQRFVNLSLALGQTQQAARLLSRALATTRDAAVRARVGVDVGEVFLQTGDTERAGAAFSQVLEADHDPLAMLNAARRLQELTQDSTAPEQRARVLALLVQYEPEKERRQAAARRLAKLCETELEDEQTAMLAYRALLGSPWSDDAIQKLELLYEKHQSPEGMADLLSFKAERTKDPEEAKTLAFQAAELRSRTSEDHVATLAAWRALVERYGPSRKAYDHVIPLLERLEDYEGLADALLGSVKLQGPEEAAPTLARLGQLYMDYLGDARSALDAFRQALLIDPAEATSRERVRQLLSVTSLELDAADVLEPLYRAEGNAPELVQLLQTRAAASADVDQRLEALSEAVSVAEQTHLDNESILEMAGRALQIAAEERPSLISPWLARVRTYTENADNHARLSSLLQRALGERPIDNPALLELARDAGDALAAAGEVELAVATYRRALAFAGSNELMDKIDQLLMQQGSPAERLELYESALEQESDSEARVPLLRSIAELRWRELKDYPGASAAFRAILSATPGDRGARLALVDVLCESGEVEAAYAELEQILPELEGTEHQLVLARLGDLANRLGFFDRALEHYKTLLQSEDLSDEQLAHIETVAAKLEDVEVVRSVLERRIRVASDPAQKLALLERAGSGALERDGDKQRATDLWREAGLLAEQELSDPDLAIRLYERVLSLSPDSPDTARRLLDLYTGHDQWSKVSVPFTILRQAHSLPELTELLLSLEDRAVAAGAHGVFGSLADALLTQTQGSDEGRPILLAKARVLSLDPQRREEATANYRQLIETAQDDAHEEVAAFEQFLAASPNDDAQHEERRWLYQFQIEHSKQPVPMLLGWAHMEERDFTDLDRATELYERVLEHESENTEALTELARLKALKGDAEGALASLEALRERSEGKARAEVDLAIAKLLMDPLKRPAEALARAREYMKGAPADPEALELCRRALDFPESRAEAAKYLENAADAFEDPGERAQVLEALLEISEDSSDLREARGRWLKGLLAIKSDDPEGSLEVALRAAEQGPEDDELWKAAERFARQLERPDPVALAYSRVIARDLPPDLAETLGRRVVEFHEEWFEDNQRVVELLRRVLELSPTATWAFDRLKLEFNAKAQWADLFALYDSGLSHASDDATRTELLREVSMAAKDFAGDAEKAIGYLEQLHQINPSDERVEASLERLYERNNHYRPLIELLSARLEDAEENAGIALRERMARLWMQLDEPLPALELLQFIIEQGQAARVVDLLETLVALPASRESMTPAPMEEQASRAKRRRQRLISVRERASQYLRHYYQETGSITDVVRMLEVSVETAQDDEQRIRRLKQIIRVRLNDLEDAAGAFDNVCQLVALQPGEKQFRSLLYQLAGRLELHERQADLLVQVASEEQESDLKIALLSEAAAVHQEQLGNLPRSIELYLQVLEFEATHPEPALHAARQLDPMLAEAERPEERCTVLEKLAELEPEPHARLAARAEAARVAFEQLGNADRAIANWKQRLALDEQDLDALDGLVLGYTKAEHWDELVQTLGARSKLQSDPHLKRADLVSVARVHVDMRADVPAAIDAWRLVYGLSPEDGEAFDALVSLLTHEERWQELAELLDERAGREEDDEQRAALNRQLGEVHRSKTEDLGAALDAFIRARDWERAREVVSTPDADKKLILKVCRSLLDQAVSVWLAAPDSEDAAAGAAEFAIGELSRRLLNDAEHDEVVELLLKGADLPFEDAYSRRLRQQAAFLCADQLEDSPRAIQIFKGLFSEDPADEVAASSVERLAQLFSQAELFDELVSLWEQQAQCREVAGETSKAAELWTLAGQLSEDRLSDVDRAMRNYRRGSALRGEQALESLARLHSLKGEALQAAWVLEWLCAHSSPAQLAERALTMADQYLTAGRPGVARTRLEQAAKLASEPAPIRHRLAELYRAAKKYTPLAELLAHEAELAKDKRKRLELLVEAARLHVHEREDPNSAVPLLAEAVQLEPEDTDLRLSLAEALRRAQRYDEAIAALREQIERYGARRPKRRAIVHYRLGLVCIAADRRSEALTELDTANKIDPAHPGVSQALARLAFEEGDLDRAERMYRSLLLVLGNADSEDAPSRATALLDLSEIAARKGDTLRSEEFIESAFESALEHENEAKALETALKERGRVDLLSRALETRLKEDDLAPGDAARALGNLVQLALDGHAQEFDKDRFRDRAEVVLRRMQHEASTDPSAWTALSKVFDYVGDRDKEALILEQQVASWEDQGELPDSAEPYFRLAAARLATEETRGEGVELLERALSIENDVERANTLLEAALAEGTKDARAIRLFEKMARTSGNPRSLLEALSMAAGLPDSSIKVLREGVQLAEELGKPELKQAILERGAARDEGTLAPQDHAWLLMELAEVREAAGDAASAYDLRETAAERLPTDEARALLLAVAQAARAQGALARAARVLERLRTREPQDREVWEPLLLVYRELGDGAHIAALLDETIPLVDNSEDRSRLRLDQANVVLAQGDEDRAIQILRDTLEEDPRHLEAAETLTSLLKRSGRTTELAELLRVQLDAAKDRQKVDSIVAASMQLGHLLESKEHHQDASDVYRAVLDWDQGNRDALRGVVRMAELTQDNYAIADAVEALLKVEDPEPAQALVKRLIQLREESHDIEGVERALELAVHANPLDVDQREALVRRYRERGDFGKAAELLARALKLSPGHPELLRQVVAAYRESNNLEAALEAIDRLIDASPDAPDLLRQRAELRVELQDPDGALEDLDKAYSLDPSDPDSLIASLKKRLELRPDDQASLLHLIDVLVEARMLDQAREHLRAFVDLYPGERAALIRLANLDREAKDFAAATRSLRQLIDLEHGEELVPLALELAKLAEAAGSPEDARDALERALSVAPGNPELTALLRRMYESVGAHRELAELLLNEAGQASDDETRLGALVAAAGYLLEDETQAEQAIEILEQARSLAPQDLDVATLLARAYSALGRRHEALMILEEAANAHRGRRVKGLVGLYVEMANIFQEADASAEALQALTKAHEFDLKNPHLAMRLGRMALEQAQDQVALRAFRSVTIMKPSEELPASDVSRLKAEAHYHLALLAQRQGDLRKAKILCSKALSENSEHEAAAAMLAQLKKG